MIILVLNSGSSSLKYRLLEMPREVPLASGKVERIGESAGSALLVHTRQGEQELRASFECPDHRRALEKLLATLTHGAQACLSRVEEIEALGHRVVHGRDLFPRPCLVSDETLARMKELIELAPLHMPANISCIEACRETLPGVPQVAHFDTSFFQSMPKHAFLYPVPMRWHEDFAIRRYGFHGASHEYVTLAASEMLGTALDRLKLITAHLGNGASITAFEAGRVLDTSMGFTPLEGLMMGTRAGFLDPAAIPYLMSKAGLTLEEVVDALNQQSGLAGVGGMGRDLRNILAARARGHERADLAFRMFIHTLRKYTGAYTFAMGGADAFVFTGGIGENSPEVRAALFEDLAPLGFEIDGEKNEAAARRSKGAARSPECISAPSSRVKILVIPTDEELLIGRETYRQARALSEH